MAKIRKFEYIHSDGTKHGKPQYLYMCPGCGYEHAFGLISDGGHHDFNMDYEKPTIRPSLLQNFSPDRICHAFIIDGYIQFLNDCWHKLAGQTVELPQVKEIKNERDRTN